MSELSNAPVALEQKPFETNVLSVHKEETWERARTDINFFGSLAIPTVMLSPFPAFYVAIFHMLVNRSPEQIGRILRFALGLPRGHAKTTFIKVLIAWLIVYDKLKFIVVVCANEDLALEIVSDINDILASDNIEQIYGRWSSCLTTDSKELKKAFYHNRNVTIAAKGEGSSMRGINIKHERPDVILFDDAQTKECDESPTDSAKFKRRFTATMKIIAPKGNRLIVYIGNMYSDNCMLYKLKENSKWVSLITGAILESGEPLWPELHSLEELLDGYLHDVEMGEEEVWFAEVMNDPVSKAKSLVPDGIPRAPYSFVEEVPDGVFITLDPAGFRDNSDDNVIAVHYVFNGMTTVREIEAGNKNPEQLVMETLRKCLEHGASVIGIEETGYQMSLLFWMTKYLKDWNITGVHVVPLKPRNRSKEARIRLFIEEVIKGTYAIHDACRALWLWQAMKYKIGKKDNKDDILDAPAYGLDVRNEYWHLVKNLKQSGMFLLEGTSSVVEDNTPF